MNPNNVIYYEWTSTSSGSCFVRGRTTKIVSTRYLHSYDSGVHTCTVYDVQYSTGNASITVNVVGEHRFDTVIIKLMINHTHHHPGPCDDKK